MPLPLVALTVLLTRVPPVSAASTEKLDVAIRGSTVALTIYRPKSAPRGTIVMGSGDVGWVGLAVSMAEELAAQGYIVAGVNARQYLSTFTSGKAHLQTKDVPADYRLFANRLKEKQLLVRPVVLSGVSEGAALAVLAASDPGNHAWIDGVVTMGLPATAELAWRWTDLWASAMKRDADEPSFTVADVLPGISPVPLCMIQSKKDEYVTPAEYQKLLEIARDPKELVLIDASNHRFTDRRPELSRAFAAGLEWIARAPKR
jgi:alpha-beta hydrolase superfamily lysophospholipase